MNKEFIISKRIQYFGIEGAVEVTENDIEFLNKDKENALEYNYYNDWFMDYMDCQDFLFFIKNKIEKNKNGSKDVGRI